MSISVHAERVDLPRGATLIVYGSSANYQYTRTDLRAGALWSRILRGDTLTLTLTVPLAARRLARVEIVSIQAGYRGLGIGAKNHPAFDSLRAEKSTARPSAAANGAATGTSNSSCIENYQCDATPANTGPAKASVALTIANAVQCSGTLINNVRNDGNPLILTARHCQNGKAGGGVPQNATAVTVYWSATSACGSVLGDLYDPSIQTQTGARTIFEQQDMWLVQLAASPVVASPYFAPDAPMPMTSCAPRFADRNARPVTQGGRLRPD